MIMKRYRLLPVAALLSMVMAGCSDDLTGGGEQLWTDGNEIRLQAEIDQENVTRANDLGFTDGDCIGIYAVNYTESMNPGSLETSGNLADNVAFDYIASENRWTGAMELYFQDDKTPVDFYGYYPYVSSIADVRAYSFSVARNQMSQANGKMSGYEASDFLWGKTPAVTPSTKLVNITFVHALAGIQIRLVEGSGFESGEWARLDKSVMVSNTVRNATINLETGVATQSGSYDGSDIIAARHNDDFRAIVIPQTIKASTKLLDIMVDGKSYDFMRQTDMVYNRMKLHRFTIEVSKSSKNGDYEISLIDESITAWESDYQSHNGAAKEYLIINVPKAGSLENSVKSLSLDSQDIVNLKIEGELSESDFCYLRLNFKNLEAINLRDATLQNDILPDMACAGMASLSNVVFPSKLVRIGNSAFLGTQISGSLDFPEGLEYIGSSAFQSTTFGHDTPGWGGFGGAHDGTFPDGHPTVLNNLTGTLTLPSTVKFIGDAAFANCDFTGQLVLPEGLEHIGVDAFANCKYMTGEIHMPSAIKELGGGAFAGMEGITGVFEIPRHITRVENYGLPNVRVKVFPDAPTEIAEKAFTCSEYSGDIKVPETVYKIGRHAFSLTKISHIILPPYLDILEDGLCQRCPNLMDTITIPPLVETIGERAFADCPKLEAIVLPARLERIRNEAFAGCYSLAYVRCDAVNPPELPDNAFWGVDKDNFTVEVPEGSVDAYRNAPGWSEFKRIAAYRNFVARPSKFNVLNKGGKKEIILNADTDWELADCPSWCHIDKASGSKKTVLNLIVDKMNQGGGNRSGKISFRLKGKSDYETHINVTQCDYEYEEDSYLQLQKATKGAGIDLFFCGDGYDAFDISTGIYLEDMRQEMEYFFAVEPYTTYRDYFNVYTSFALSEDSGVESLNYWRNTKFKTCIGDGVTRLSAGYVDAMNYCAETVTPIVNKANPQVGVILVANSSMYEGVTYVMDNSFCTVVTKSDLDYPNDARGLIQHEAGGHGIGWLGDEYRYHEAFIQKCQCMCCGHVSELQGDQAWGYSLNLSLTGKYKEVPWSHLIFNPTYGDIVDIYEGGYFHTRGVYRSEYNSCMNNNVPYFSTWSRQLIVQRIMKLAGETFSLDSFYAKDSRKTGRDFTGTRSEKSAETQSSLRGQAPVFIKNYKFGKKGGRK